MMKLMMQAIRAVTGLLSKDRAKVESAGLKITSWKAIRKQVTSKMFMNAIELMKW